MSETTEIVIIGGGIVGASIAFHLADKGARGVVLLDKGTLASGETGKSGGFVQTHWDTLAEVRLIAHSREVFATWAERVGAPEPNPCGWTRGGYLHVTGSEREPDVRRVHAMLVAEGLDSHWLDPRQLAELQPLLNTDQLVGGAWEPTSGWCAPVATTRAFAAAARARGATIREAVRVTRIVHAGGAITGVETDAGPIAARTVILAAGPHAPRLHALPELPLPIDVRRGQICHMDRPGGHVQELGLYDEVTGLYTHPLGDRQLVGRDRGSPFPPVPDPDSYAREVDGKWVVRAALALGQRFPALREARIVRGITGLYDFTPDDQPIVDGPLGGLAGYYVAAGFSGVGFKSAPATGLGMAELVLDGRASSVDIAHLRFARFA